MALPHPPPVGMAPGLNGRLETALIFHSPPPPALFHTSSQTFPFLPTLLFKEASAELKVTGRENDGGGRILW